VAGWAAALLLALTARPGLGADKKTDKATDKSANKLPDPEKVKFETTDQVELRGTYYPSPRKNAAPCVILLHSLKGDSQQKGWSELALALQEKEYAVLSFDFRGHGGSTSVDPQIFWAQPANRMVRGFSPTRPRDTISYKDFPTGYYANLVNDIAAAKTFLDSKNDSGECNSANLILIGAESGATIGALWMKEEFRRHRVIAGRQIDEKPEGKDILCAVWLSYSSSLSPQSGGYPLPAASIIRLARDKKIAMAFFYGDKDPAGITVASSIKRIPESERKKLVLGSKAIKEAGKVKGHNLLAKGLGTDKAIIAYLQSVLDTKRPNAHDTKEFRKQAFIWAFRQSIIAKTKDEKTLRFIRGDLFVR
jgi:hypothetical protein